MMDRTERTTTVDAQDLLAQQFEEHRPRLRAVAQRMLGSGAEVDDAVQEAWLRLAGADADAVRDLGAWLTTVVARVSMDLLRARDRRATLDAGSPLLALVDSACPPAEAVELADAVGDALVVVLDALAPAERLAFVLHDTFAVPYDEIGPILGRSTTATKQLAHRARAKVQGASAADGTDPGRQRAVVDAFLAAAREGDFDALLTLLHPEVTLLADGAAVRMGSPASTTGAAAVATTFSGRALGAQPAVVDGAVGFAWAIDGRTKVVWDIAIVDGRIAHLDMLAAPDTLTGLDLELLAP